MQTTTTISGEYGLYVRARTLVLDDVYYLPPHKVEFSVDGGPVTTWEFRNLPGGASNTDFVNDYVALPTCGDYSRRDFYIDLGFTTAGQRTFPTSVLNSRRRPRLRRPRLPARSPDRRGAAVGEAIFFDDFEDVEPSTPTRNLEWDR